MRFDPLARIRYMPSRTQLSGVLPRRQPGLTGVLAAQSGAGIGTSPVFVAPPVITFNGFYAFQDVTGPYFDTAALSGPFGITVDGTGPYLDAASTAGVAVDGTGPYVAGS